MKQKFNSNIVEFKKDDEKAYNEEVQYLILVNGQHVGKTYKFQPSDYDKFGVYRKMGAKLWSVQMNEGFERIRYKFSNRKKMAEYLLAIVLKQKEVNIAS